jgi:hypothetical protein
MIQELDERPETTWIELYERARHYPHVSPHNPTSIKPSRRGVPRFFELSMNEFSNHDQSLLCISNYSEPRAAIGYGGWRS